MANDTAPKLSAPDVDTGAARRRVNPARAGERPIPATPRWSPGSAETLIRLWNAGLATSAIAARLGVSPRAVDSKVRKLRVAGYPLAARRPRPPRQLRRARRVCLYCGEMFASSHVGNRLCPSCLEDGPFGGIPL